MATEGDIDARFVRWRRHKVIIAVSCAAAAGVAGLWHIYLYYREPMSYYRRPYPVRGPGGFYLACIVMWPFLVFAVKAVRSISSKYKDLFLSMAAIVGGLVALCAYDSYFATSTSSYFEYYIVECWIMTAMISVPHFLMDGLEE
jgi:multisubunit Na+/H+ antiporter MnhB subunit